MKNENPRKNPLTFKNRWNLVSVLSWGLINTFWTVYVNNLKKNKNSIKRQVSFTKWAWEREAQIYHRWKWQRLRSEVNVSLSDVSGASMNNRSMGRVLDFWMIARHQGFCSQSLKKGSYIEKSQNYHAGTPIVQPQQARSVLFVVVRRLSPKSLSLIF